MIGLLDASFVRHLEYARALYLIRAARAGLGWEFVVPAGAHAELARKHVPAEVTAMLLDGAVGMGHYGEDRAGLMGELRDHVGMGEAEAICIIDACEDRTFRTYTLLTDDVGAQAEAGRRGMSSMGAVEFVGMANRKGLVASGAAMAALGALEASGHVVDEAARADFVRRLV